MGEPSYLGLHGPGDSMPGHLAVSFRAPAVRGVLLGPGLPAAALAACLVRNERGYQLREGCMWFSRILGGRTGP